MSLSESTLCTNRNILLISWRLVFSCTIYMERSLELLHWRHPFFRNVVYSKMTPSQIFQTQYRTTVSKGHGLIRRSSKWFQPWGNCEFSAMTAMAPRGNRRERRNRERWWKKETECPSEGGRRLDLSVWVSVGRNVLQFILCYYWRPVKQKVIGETLAPSWRRISSQTV